MDKRSQELDLENLSQKKQQQQILYQQQYDEQDTPKRISESYPPTTINNQTYIADVHSALNEIDMNDIDLQNDIISRHISNHEDIEQLKQLHSEWFPIPYEQDFFDNLLSKNSMNLLLELDLSKFGKQKYIIGAIIYVKRSTKFKEMRFNLSELCKDSYCYYVQTIGVINEFRKCGFASYLLDYVKQEGMLNKRIRYISLHMVVYNKSGERFYLKNGFKIIERLNDFYYIENKDYDSFLFCFYINGCQPPVSFYNYVTNTFGYVKNQFKSIIFNRFTRNSVSNNDNNNNNNNNFRQVQDDDEIKSI